MAQCDRSAQRPGEKGPQKSLADLCSPTQKRFCKMVFFIKRAKKVIMVEPHLLGPKIDQTINDLLMWNVEGRHGEDGVALTVIRIVNRERNGMIDHLSGSVKYTIEYEALFFRPFINEVVDAVVTNVDAVS